MLDRFIYGHSRGMAQNKLQFIDDLINVYFKFSSVTVTVLEQSFQLCGNTTVVRHVFIESNQKWLAVGYPNRKYIRQAFKFVCYFGGAMIGFGGGALET